MHSFEVHTPTSKDIGPGQQLVHSIAAVAWEELHDPTHLLQELPIPIHFLGMMSLRPPMLVKHSAGSTFRDPLMPQASADGIYRSSPTLRAYKFGRAASFKINMSRAWSATRRFSLAFSFCNS